MNSDGEVKQDQSVGASSSDPSGFWDFKMSPVRVWRGTFAVKTERSGDPGGRVEIAADSTAPLHTGQAERGGECEGEWRGGWWGWRVSAEGTEDVHHPDGAEGGRGSSAAWQYLDMKTGRTEGIEPITLIFFPTKSSFLTNMTRANRNLNALCETKITAASHEDTGWLDEHFLLAAASSKTFRSASAVFSVLA